MVTGQRSKSAAELRTAQRRPRREPRLAVMICVVSALVVACSPTREPGPSPVAGSPHGSLSGVEFIPAPRGTQPAGSFSYDEENVGGYVSARELRAYRDAGFRRLVSRSYYGLKEGGVVVTLIEADEPARLASSLARARGEVQRPFPALPHGRVRDHSAHLGDGAINYSRTLRFVSRPYLAEVTGWDYGPPESRTRAYAAASAQLALLRAGT